MLRRQIEQMFTNHGISPVVRVECSFTVSAMKMAALGIGLTITDQLTAEAEPLRSTAIRPIEPAFQMPFGSFRPASGRQSESAIRFIDTLREVIAERLAAFS